MIEQVFISSVQKELQAERYAVRDFVHNNDLLRQFFKVFLFEDLSPADRRPDGVYLDEVKKSMIYVGIFGDEYGWREDGGLSATEKEFNAATAQQKRRFILVKGREDASRNPKMQALILRAGDELVRRRFEDTDELLRLLYGSMIQYLQDRGFVAARDFDAAPCANATLSDISAANVRWFLEKARDERRYALPIDTSPERTLAHLNLMAGSRPTMGAIMLFSERPDRFIPAAEVMCLHFHSTVVAKPIPSQQVYRGTLFEVVNKSVDFVMGALARAVEPGTNSVSSDVTYEIPYPVVREAVVNAVAHRNYASKSAVQVMVFADRVEVWNPGGLPEDLTVRQLRQPHSSVPRNRLICEPLFLAHYIERAGTGTLDMIRLCHKAGLPEPEFQHEGERFVVTIWRHWLTDKVMAQLRLNDRQKKALDFLKKMGRITNREYQEVTGAGSQTALRDLRELMESGILEKVGATGRGTYYTLCRKPDINPTNPSRAGRANQQ
jgi:predicted HTH transcriptional regulator